MSGFTTRRRGCPMPAIAPIAALCSAPFTARLNHILIGDRIWMHVFTGEGVRPSRLDAILYDDFAALRLARRAEDARICTYV
jgi:hypothetical protein